MNNLIKTTAAMNISKEAYSLFKKGGKYGCIALGIWALYDLCVKGMDKGYAFNVGLDQEGKVTFNFTPASAIPVES